MSWVAADCRIEDGLSFAGDAVDVLGDEELVVGTVDGVVEDSSVQPDLRADLA